MPATNDRKRLRELSATIKTKRGELQSMREELTQLVAEKKALRAKVDAEKKAPQPR